LSRLGRTDENGIPRRNAMMREIDPDLARFIGEACWGSLWSRPQLTVEPRSLAVIACLRRDDNLDGHIEAGLDLEFSPEQIVEIPSHLLFYRRAPIANTALHICYGVFTRRGLTINPTRHHDTSMDSEELYDRGVAQRQLIMGGHVAGDLEENSDSVDQDGRRYLTEYLWGAVWTRPLLHVKQRMICTLAALSEISNEQALRNYIWAAIRVGLSRDEVKELFYHLTFYISLPHARRGKALANDVLSNL